MSEPTDDEVIDHFGTGISGASAAVNTTAWFTCPTCGACVADSIIRGPWNRRLHLRWHEVENGRSPDA